MRLELTFLFEVPDSAFPILQQPIAEHANHVQPDKQLIADVKLPLGTGGTYDMRGVLVEAKESHL